MIMRILVLVALLLSTPIILYSQSDNIEAHIANIEDLNAKIGKQQRIISQQNNLLEKLNKSLTSADARIDSLSGYISENKNNIERIAHDLGIKIQQTEITAKDGISKLDKDVVNSRLYWIVGFLVTLLLGGIVYWLLGKRIKNNKADVETQIRNTKKSLEEESIKLDSKLIEVLESQLKLKQEEKQNAPTNSNNRIDHSLALKVADEIVRMQKNISKMDDDTKGLKPLIKGIERIQANFASNGYEMVNLLNKDYDERMNIDVINFITDENLTEGRKIITAVIKPQVNYNGILIQRAQVDVSQN